MMLENTVQAILINNGVNPENFNEKVFLVGEWSRDTQRNMKICNVTGLVRLNEAVIGDPFVEKLPTITDLQQGKNFPEMLLTVQALILIKIKDETFVPLLQNTPNDKFNPGHWTLPMGHMDHSSFTIGALTKFLEEIRLISKNKHILPYHFCIEKNEVIRLFRKSWNAIALKHAAPHSSINEQELLLVKMPEIADHRKVQIINNGIMSRADSGITILNGPKNTMELVVPISLTLPELPSIYDGRFERKATLVPITTLLESGWLEEHPATFALHTLLNQHAKIIKQLAS